MTETGTPLAHRFCLIVCIICGGGGNVNPYPENLRFLFKQIKNKRKILGPLWKMAPEWVRIAFLGEQHLVVGFAGAADPSRLRRPEALDGTNRGEVNPPRFKGLPPANRLHAPKGAPARGAVRSAA